MTQQTVFAAHLPCLSEARPVIELMSDISESQRWGLARVAGSASKGGWGPDEHWDYLVRQFAVISTPRGQTAVAIAAEPTSGTFSTGVALLDKLTAWVQAQSTKLPAGHCGIGGGS
ncbi:hypothetical protein [Skermania sp. ID1734]|uniref:hypothetical protein n=1 Tax=Skermania sp. ID1734 TaxID=2597516 RepID=UPI002105B953|nr:hypothetical protein [Skermania sp. ID1734]